jgi:hypothetical protein
MMDLAGQAAGLALAHGLTRCLIRYLTWALLVGSSGPCLAQVITLRVINEKNGRALPGLDISVSLSYRKGEKFPQSSENLHLKADGYLTLHLKTDAGGVARLDLPQPLPLQLWAGAGLPSQDWECSCATSAFVAAQDVIEKGIVERLDRKSSKVPDAKPGEIIFVARRYNLFYRLMAPLMKE